MNGRVEPKCHNKTTYFNPFPTPTNQKKPHHDDRYSRRGIVFYDGIRVKDGWGVNASI